jgi:lysophospholipase L1-like esterase
MCLPVGAAVIIRRGRRWSAVSALLAAFATAPPTSAQVAAGAARAAEAAPTSRPAYWRERTSLFRAFAGHADVVMLGDSLTDGAEWHEIFPDQAIVNRGIDGDTADGVRERLDDVLALRPLAVVLMIGINDLTDGGRSVEAVFADVRAIVGRLTAAGARVVLMSTLPCHVTLGAWKSCAAAAAGVRALDLRLAGLASAGVAYVDLASRLAGEAGLRPEYTYDGVHLNGDGYRVWRDAIAGLMPAGLQRTRPRR